MLYAQSQKAISVRFPSPQCAKPNTRINQEMDRMLEVNISLNHSSPHASVLLSSAYPLSLRGHIKNLETSRILTLKEEVHGSTSLRHIKHLLEIQYQIPLSVQSYFWLQTDFGTEWVKCTYEDDFILSEIWSSQADPGDGFIDLNLLTTAARLGEIVSLQNSINGFHSGRDSLVDCLLDWRHCDGALRYLENNPKNGQDSDQMAVFGQQLEDCRKLELRSAQLIRQMFADWALLIHGSVIESPSNEETREQRTQDIETCFKDWLLDKQKVLSKALTAHQAITATSEETKSQADNEEVPQTVTMVPEQDVPESDSDNSESPEPILLESRLSFNFPQKNPAFVSHPLHAASDISDPDCNTFTVKSGVILWGQIHTVFAGSISHDFDTNASSTPETLQGGTIKQHVMKYKAAARNGSWKVRRAFCIPYPGNEGEPTKHFGWVVFHEDVDAAQVLDRCNRISPASTAISNQNDHVDQVRRALFLSFLL